MEAIPIKLSRHETVFIDSSYANGDEVAALEELGIEVLVTTGAEEQRLKDDFRPPIGRKRS